MYCGFTSKYLDRMDYMNCKWTKNQGGLCLSALGVDSLNGEGIVFI